MSELNSFNGISSLDGETVFTYASLNFFDNRSILIEGTLVNGKKDGKWKAFLNKKKIGHDLYKNGEFIKSKYNVEIPSSTIMPKVVNGYLFIPSSIALIEEMNINIDITDVSSAFNVEVAVYSGSCGNLICTGFKDTAATGVGASENLSVIVDATTQYWINVGSNSASDETEGAFKIALSSGSGVILGVDKIEDNLDVSLYPNPTSDIINIRYNNAIDAIRIYNLLGQEVKNVTLNKSRTQIDMSNFNSGMYIVEVYSGSSKGSYRVIKQ